MKPTVFGKRNVDFSELDEFMVGAVNGLSCFILGYVLSVFTDFRLFLVAVFSVFLIITSFIPEIIRRGMYRAVTLFLVLSPASIVVGYILSGVIGYIVDFVAGFAVNSARFISSIYPTSFLGIPIVAFTIPLLIAGIEAITISIYLSAVLSGYRYPFLVFSILFPVSIFKVAFITYIGASYIVYIVSMAIAAGMHIYVSLLESLAGLAGLAFALLGDVYIVRWIVDVPRYTVSAIVEGGLQGEVPDAVGRYYVFQIFMYIMYAFGIYSGYVSIWKEVAYMSMIAISAGVLSTMVFYLGRMERPRMRIVRILSTFAAGMDTLSMVPMLATGLAYTIVSRAILDTVSTLMPVYKSLINTFLRFIIGG